MTEATHQRITSVLAALHLRERWRDFYIGGCGPAAIALNEEILAGKGSYVVSTNLEDGSVPLPWSGHVAVYFDGVLFDYYETWTWLEFGRCMNYKHPIILVDAEPELIREHFLIHWEERLEEARELVRSVVEQLKTCSYPYGNAEV